jgi:hypothetical protein
MSVLGPFKNGFIEIGGVDLSDHCAEFSIEEGAAELPEHAHGDDVDGIRPGLLTWTVRGTFLQDFALASVDATLNPLLTNRTRLALRMRADSAAVAPTNPMYSGMAYLVSYSPMKGPHGAELMADAVFRCARGSMLSRQTS